MPFAPVSFCRTHVSAVPALMAPDAELCKRCLYRWTRHASSQLHHGTVAGSFQLHLGTVAGSAQLSQVDLTAWQGQACQRGSDQRQIAQAACSLLRSLLPSGTGAAGLARAGVQAGRR